MSKENQIDKQAVEEMARDICSLAIPCEECAMYAEKAKLSKERYCKAKQYAQRAYNKGYRKQSVGEWEKVINHKECSKCGYKAPYKKIKAGYHLLDLTKFCPNCGAKMKGGNV